MYRCSRVVLTAHRASISLSSRRTLKYTINTTDPFSLTGTGQSKQTVVVLKGHLNSKLVGRQMTFRVNLTGPPPWGFRICGGRDFKRTLTVSKVHEGGRARDAGLRAGDVILEINGQDTGAMLNVEAQNKIKINEDQLCLLIERW
ncbi:PDZ and LIM domain protein 2 [Anabarilius grahami]|uniref:PDZ and LIM domain protein 2 n=1 Tax=Anabarilius grahami TaxID=495550 RepID=A0A3N0Z6Q0_ANAGA|nr:PDZ and LIM domain protein 2 [Anabarilius grahami]